MTAVGMPANGRRGLGRSLSNVRPFPFLLLPTLWASQNRARRREKGDLLRGVLFGGVAIGVLGALFFGAFWLTWQAAQYVPYSESPRSALAGSMGISGPGTGMPLPVVVGFTSRSAAAWSKA